MPKLIVLTSQSSNRLHAKEFIQSEKGMEDL